MRGDILFYANDHTLIGNLVCWWTHGPYIHVEVDWDDGKAIGAGANGVTLHPLAAPQQRFPTSTFVDADSLARGLLFVASTLHFPYSYRDITDAGPLRLLGLYLAGGNGYDCSHLVADYLIAIGLGARLGRLEDAPQSVSPNDLARACGLLKGN